MRALRFLYAVAVALFMSAALGYAASASSDFNPTDDLVSVADGKLMFEEHSVCRIELPSWAPGQHSGKFQVRTHAEAPASGVISRDNFVALTTQISMMLRLSVAQKFPGLTLEQAVSALKCSTIGAPIGKVDLEINTYMTKDGLQVETIDTASGRTSRVTETWDDVWGE